MGTCIELNTFMECSTIKPSKLWFEYDLYQDLHRYIVLKDQEKEILRCLREDGYYYYKNALDEETLESLSSALDHWVEAHTTQLDRARKEDGTFPRLIGLDKEVPQIQQLFAHKVTHLFQDLFFGHRSALHASITFLQGSQQALHRDIPIFKTSFEEQFFRIWFALEDTDDANGTLMGVRGGHKIETDTYKQQIAFYSSKEDIPEQDPVLWLKHQSKLADAYKKAGLSVEHFRLNKGDALIWHPLFPHGGSPIQDKLASRRSIVVHLSAVEVI